MKSIYVYPSDIEGPPGDAGADGADGNDNFIKGKIAVFKTSGTTVNYIKHGTWSEIDIHSASLYQNEALAQIMSYGVNPNTQGYIIRLEPGTYDFRMVFSYRSFTNPNNQSQFRIRPYIFEDADVSNRTLVSFSPNYNFYSSIANGSDSIVSIDGHGTGVAVNMGKFEIDYTGVPVGWSKGIVFESIGYSPTTTSGDNTGLVSDGFFTMMKSVDQP